jgi:hypothetical protein
MQGKKVKGIQIFDISKMTQGLRCGSVAEHLPGIQKVLGSIPSTKNRRKKKVTGKISQH